MAGRWRWKGVSAPFPTRSPGRAAGGDCSVDPGTGGLPHGLRSGAGGGVGAAVRLSAASAPPAHDAFRQPFPRRHRLGVDLPVLRHLRRGYPGGLRHRPSGRGNWVGCHGRMAPAAYFFTVLEDFGQAKQARAGASEKIFRFFEIFICICGKMGYNRQKATCTARQAQREGP